MADSGEFRDIQDLVERRARVARWRERLMQLREDRNRPAWARRVELLLSILADPINRLDRYSLGALLRI